MSFASPMMSTSLFFGLVSPINISLDAVTVALCEILCASPSLSVAGMFSITVFDNASWGMIELSASDFLSSNK